MPGLEAALVAALGQPSAIKRYAATRGSIAAPAQICERDKR